MYTKIKIVRFYCENCALYTDCDLSVYNGFSGNVVKSTDLECDAK